MTAATAAIYLFIFVPELFIHNDNDGGVFVCSKHILEMILLNVSPRPTTHDLF